MLRLKLERLKVREPQLLSPKDLNALDKRTDGGFKLRGLGFG